MKIYMSVSSKFLLLKGEGTRKWKKRKGNMKNGKGKTKLTGTKGKQKYGMDTR